MPHGHCYLWMPQLVWLHVISDGLTALAYTSIPFTLVYFIRKRKDVPYNWMFVAFGAFIIACGATHVMEIYTLWTPAYWLSGAIKAVTAVASVTTAALLIRVIPQVLAIPRAEDLRAAQREVALERQKADDERLRLAAIVDSSSDAIIGQDLSGIVTSWNEGAYLTFGYRAEEVLGRSLALLLPPGEEEKSPDIVARLKRGERAPRSTPRAGARTGGTSSCPRSYRPSAMRRERSRECPSTHATSRRSARARRSSFGRRRKHWPPTAIWRPSAPPSPTICADRSAPSTASASRSWRTTRRRWTPMRRRTSRGSPRARSAWVTSSTPCSILLASRERT